MRLHVLSHASDCRRIGLESDSHLRADCPHCVRQVSRWDLAPFRTGLADDPSDRLLHRRRRSRGVTWRSGWRVTSRHCHCGEACPGAWLAWGHPRHRLMSQSFSFPVQEMLFSSSSVRLITLQLRTFNGALWWHNGVLRRAE